MIKVKDLPERDRSSEERTAPDGSTSILVGRPVFLYCRRCGERYSATRGDYVMADPDLVLTCCQRPMVLVREQREIVPVTAEQAARNGRA